jgi:molybdopterin synthase catalytic subunit
MQVRVLFFGILKDLTGKSSDSIELAADSSAQDVLAHYGSLMPRLKSTLPSLAIAINQQYSAPETKLREGDEIALLPPVSGGAPDRTDEAAKLRAGEMPSSRGHVLIVRDPIDAKAIVTALKSGEDGSVVVFEGIVRNQTRGRKTLYLDYESYEPMAEREMNSLVAEGLKQFAIRDVAIVHRLGRLEIGDTSVLIAVVSAHRAAGFEASRWLIDTLKRTVPIWKKEYFEDGAVWADGEPFPGEIPRANSAD